jgi:hypothetical protein
MLRNLQRIPLAKASERYIRSRRRTDDRGQGSSKEVGYERFGSEVEPERTATGFDAGYYGKMLEKGWEEAGFVFR